MFFVLSWLAFFFNSVLSKLQSKGKNVAALGHIILVASKLHSMPPSQRLAKTAWKWKLLTALRQTKCIWMAESGTT